jgi:hypothetical protein
MHSRLRLGLANLASALVLFICRPWVLGNARGELSEGWRGVPTPCTIRNQVSSAILVIESVFQAFILKQPSGIGSLKRVNGLGYPAKKDHSLAS